MNSHTNPPWIVAGLFLVGMLFLTGCTSEPVGCPEDARLCPDGSVVGREGPNCEFKPCPTTDAQVHGCTKELFVCPDGTSVGRTGPNCAFASCPGSENLLIEYRSEGGYSLVKESVLRIEKNKAGLILAFRANQPAKSAQIVFSPSEWTEWENAVRTSGVLNATQADWKTCNEGDVDCPTDMSTKKLVVQLDRKTSQLEWYSLKETTPEMEALLEKINTLQSDLFERATDGGAWLIRKPLQCASNPWEKWESDSNRVYIRAPTEAEIVTNWMKEEFGIEVLEFRAKPAPLDEVQCQACDCPRGDTIAIRVLSAEAEQAKKAGFAHVACTEEAKTCPDGSVVGREGPFCEFASCPSNNDFAVHYTQSAGFVPIEIAGTTTLEIRNRFAILQHMYTKSGASFSNRRALSENEWNDWKKLIASSGILVLTQDDLDCSAEKPCMTDGPRRSIEIERAGQKVELSTDQPQSHEGWNAVMQKIDLLVEELDETPLVFSPKQCDSNPWQIAPTDACTGKANGTIVFSGDTCNSCSCQNGQAVCTLAYCATDNEEKRVKAYLAQVFGIEVKSYRLLPAPANTVVCDSCSCARGDTIEITIKGNSAGRLLDANWTLITSASQ